MAASAFNLICSGTSYHVDRITAPHRNIHAFEITYRVDLTRKRYCEGQCSSTRNLSSVSETMIVFLQEQQSRVDDTIIYAKRETGQYFNRRRWDDGRDMQVDLAEGTCRRAPFTGFPALKF